MKKLVLLIFAFLLMACEKELVDAEALGENADIVGTWIEKGYEGDVVFINPYSTSFKENDDNFIEIKFETALIDKRKSNYSNFIFQLAKMIRTKRLKKEIEDLDKDNNTDQRWR